MFGPAGVVAHFNHSLLDLSVLLFPWFETQPLKVDHSVPLFVAPSDAPRPDLPYSGLEQEQKTPC